ncbi:hypothetical protein PAERUG_P54_1_London_24_VIM_2_04_13_03719 [Pseudomonas aeruginosa]|nr:hypothetical protein PAERUG_E16_London_17_VIM_2_04_14_01462 [Pseudomonas aeruginosa]CRX22290.1 hypothetical protein PAERUG_P54_1_London_24_VIM_2_04_13_03719 [Pseudomonas aeruginosa]
MHGDVLGQFRVAAFQVDHDTDAVAVQVGADHVALDAGQAADVDVLAGLGDQGQTSFLTCFDQRSGVGQLLVEGLFQALGDEALEVVLEGQEVGLGVDFDDHGGLVVGSDLDGDRAFGGNVAGLLGSLDRTGSAHVVDGLLDVTASGGQRLLALHHAQAGTLAQFFNHGCSNFCHFEILLSGSSQKTFVPGLPDRNSKVAKRGPSPLPAHRRTSERPGISLRRIRPALPRRTRRRWWQRPACRGLPLRPSSSGRVARRGWHHRYRELHSRRLPGCCWYRQRR